MKQKKLLSLLLLIIFLFSGCTADTSVSESNNVLEIKTVETQTAASEKEQAEEIAQVGKENTDITKGAFDLSSLPKYSGQAYTVVNDNIPYFTEDEHTTTSFETYESLDSLGRCGMAFSCVGVDIMPTEERGSIGSVKPTGWQTIRYENVDGKYLYNRCHLLGYQLTGENANVRNLITGTRYLNIEGMLPFENMVADYIKETHNPVLLRVTPIFEQDNLLASGVLMEGLSMEDNGSGICFNVYCYNVQPGIVIDYSDGSNYSEDGSAPYGSAASVTTQKRNEITQGSTTYIANINTKKFHYPTCSSVGQMNESNKRYLNCTRDEVIKMGYDSCGRCTP